MLDCLARVPSVAASVGHLVEGLEEVSEEVSEAGFAVVSLERLVAPKEVARSIRTCMQTIPVPIKQVLGTAPVSVWTPLEVPADLLLAGLAEHLLRGLAEVSTRSRVNKSLLGM